MLTTVSTRYIKKLTSALPLETGLSENTIKYLKVGCQKIQNREKAGTLIFDEIYTAKSCEFSRSNGQIYGLSNEQPTKTLLSVMIKSTASKYEDVVAMVPLTKMDFFVLHNLFNDVTNAITSIGYNAVVSIVDGNSSNIKFYKKELCTDESTSFIPHPLDQDQFLYLFYDTTHIFKCSYNNFQKHIVFHAQSMKS